MMNEKEILEIVLEQWTAEKYTGAGYYAVAADGTHVAPDNPPAVRWCVWGYTSYVAQIPTYSPFWDNLVVEYTRIVRCLFGGWGTLSTVNDEMGYEAVRSVLRARLEELQEV